MLNNLKDTIRIIKIIHQDKKYITITLITAVILFISLYIVALSGIASYSLKSFIEIFGFTHSFFTFFMYILIALLAGVYLSLLVYKINLKKPSLNKEKNFFHWIIGFFGVLVGFLGCLACGTTFFGLFATPVALTYLPFLGFELRILSVIALLIAIYVISKNLVECEACKIK
ncbi:MAG TPA: hypothetical protein ENG87_00580 [Candidatus Pacearchaeota archaeon]|nr:hypothetical protein BMS3Abin17_00966 [archaeon BMS3Abin17]HDK41844.1 hypothetical protein [Candidatus Pacearchaeota archaeon]HDZ60341.1 hypothetical protein [Candidatus Pacearchaeota archaeon]